MRAMTACFLWRSSVAFAPTSAMRTMAAPSLQQLSVVAKLEDMAGSCPPLGTFDPFGFSKDASPETMKKCARSPRAQ